VRRVKHGATKMIRAEHGLGLGLVRVLRTRSPHEPSHPSRAMTTPREPWREGRAPPGKKDFAFSIRYPHCFVLLARSTPHCMMRSHTRRFVSKITFSDANALYRNVKHGHQAVHVVNCDEFPRRLLSVRSHEQRTSCPYVQTDCTTQSHRLAMALSTA